MFKGVNENLGENLKTVKMIQTFKDKTCRMIELKEDEINQINTKYYRKYCRYRLFIIEEMKKHNLSENDMATFYRMRELYP